MAKLSFDPQAIPVESLAGEPGLAPERLTEDGLRARFAAGQPWTPEITDEQLLSRLTSSKPHIRASVLLPLIAREHGLTVLLTQRTAHLTDHGGQISFPGGRAEESDASAIETALREAQEEVGLQRRHIDVIGSLPDYFTGTGYCVTPVVSIVQPPFELQADPFEVAEIFEVPLAFLMNGMHHQRHTGEFPGGHGKRSFYAMPYQGYFIWGATAGMLRNLFHFLRA